jgi:betaine reductase
MNADQRTAIGQALAEVVESARSGGPKTTVGLTILPGEHDPRELLEGAVSAMRQDSRLAVVAIGPRQAGYDDLDWLETSPCEDQVFQAMDQALAAGRLAGAVALHHPFPLGVATVGKILTPARGRPLYLAATTGISASGRAEAMVVNALLGVAVAKSQGIAEPTVGLLNLDGAAQALRTLTGLRDRGYGLTLGESSRSGGGSLLRGNDLVNPGVDVCVCDTLTGNALVKVFGTYSSGGGFEAQGAGYGPSAGRGWKRVVAIVSRACGAPVTANALIFAAQAARADLPGLVAREFARASACGLDQALEALAPASRSEPGLAAPPAHPVDEEIAGLDVLDMEPAVKLLWKKGIYAESAMGCTGPVVRVARADLTPAKQALAGAGFI